MKERSAYFDNAKLILIFLVVLGHGIFRFTSGDVFMFRICNLIYVFHMPAFIIISGYFSKSELRKSFRGIFSIAIYYVVFELLFWPISSGPFLLMPYYSLWFLLSLMCWHVMLPLLLKLKYPLLISLIISVAAGYLSQIGLLFSLLRTLVFFPFFVLGHYWKVKEFSIPNSPVIKVASLAVIGSVFALILQSSFIDINWFGGCTSNREMGHSEWYGGIYRIESFAISLVLCVCFFALVPRKRYRFTYFGGNTLNVLVLHEFVGELVKGTDFYIFGTAIGRLLVFLFSLILTISLSTNTVNNVLGYGFNPISKFLDTIKSRFHNSIKRLSRTH